MKPKDLKPPSNWEGRHVLIRDRVWYVPEYYSDYKSYSFPGWESSELFGNQNPVVVEYCSGNGAWIAAKAAQQPHLNWLAVEKKFERVRKVWSKAKNGALPNLVTLCGEACKATHHYFPTVSVQEVYINFPDPWPKTKHAKHRLVSPTFLGELHRILKPGGAIFIATDDVDYSDLTIEQFRGHPGFELSYPHPHYVTDLPGYGHSYFEELWREKGRINRYHRFQKMN